MIFMSDGYYTFESKRGLKTPLKSRRSEFTVIWYFESELDYTGLSSP